jgi:hypothetical protein
MVIDTQGLVRITDVGTSMDDDRLMLIRSGMLPVFIVIVCPTSRVRRELFEAIPLARV